jgi:hypothetical protein
VEGRLLVRWRSLFSSTLLQAANQAFSPSLESLRLKPPVQLYVQPQDFPFVHVAQLGAIRDPSNLLVVMWKKCVFWSIWLTVPTYGLCSCRHYFGSMAMQAFLEAICLSGECGEFLERSTNMCMRKRTKIVSTEDRTRISHPINLRCDARRSHVHIPVELHCRDYVQSKAGLFVSSKL